MKTQRVADLIVDVLYSAGVRRIYGIVGDSLNGITDAVRRCGDIEWVHTRPEEAAAFAAGAEAHLTGALAVCAGSCGPGNLHLINGLFEAHRSCVPVLAIAAQIPSAEIGRGYFQETHPDQLFRECSHYCELISHPSQFVSAFGAKRTTMSAFGGKADIGSSTHRFPGKEILRPMQFDLPIPYIPPPLKCFCRCVSTKRHNRGLQFADGDGHVGNDAMTIFDYLAIGLLLMMLLAAARWFAQRKFELFPVGSDAQRRSPMPKF